jgi:hypothetical protein
MDFEEEKKWGSDTAYRVLLTFLSNERGEGDEGQPIADGRLKAGRRAPWAKGVG